MYQMQIQVRTEENGVPRYEWKSVRPTDGQPYEYETSQKAWEMLNMCYPETPEKRVIETL